MIVKKSVLNRTDSRNTNMECPACGYRFSFFRRAFLNTNLGGECPECGSVLTQGKVVVFAQYALLFISLPLVAAFANKFFNGQGGWGYLLLWFVVFAVLMYIRFSAKLSVTCDPRKEAMQSQGVKDQE